ncbi:hypothetical protein ACWGH9_37165, partial [Streptomyces chryseus]
MPAVPSCLLDPVRDQFLALLPDREDRHPLGFHNQRFPDAVVFDRLVQVVVFGYGSERAADEHWTSRWTRPTFREGIRFQAGVRFAAGEKTAVIAKDLRVSVR